jgi:hypothetical protein
MGRAKLSNKELSRAEVMGRVKAGNLGLGEASELLELSYRQGKRLWARYGEGGAKALPHGNCGRESNRAYPAKMSGGAGAGEGPVRRLWGHAGGRASGQRRWAGGACRDVAALAAGSRAMAKATAAQALSAAARTQSSLW